MRWTHMTRSTGITAVPDLQPSHKGLLRTPQNLALIKMFIREAENLALDVLPVPLKPGKCSFENLPSLSPCLPIP